MEPFNFTGVAAGRWIAFARLDEATQAIREAEVRVAAGAVPAGAAYVLSHARKEWGHGANCTGEAAAVAEVVAFHLGVVARDLAIFRLYLGGQVG